MPAIFPGVRVLYGKKVEVLFPIRSLLIERRRAETGFDPLDGAAFIDACFLHVVEIFVAGNGAAAKFAGIDRGQEWLGLAGFNASFDEITHPER